ncbi:hypothetical protein F5X99DRAFT_426803 [Biscogniauxia marginata]|nr:hypothetical protein F5X99DRAFT_426803 [Biscogniauxia marginata]
MDLFPLEECMGESWVMEELADKHGPAEDDRIIWDDFLSKGPSKYCVPAALRREGEVLFGNKLPTLFRLFSTSDDFVSPVDMMLLFHVYMLDTCVTRDDWETWLEGLDVWLQGVMRRVAKAEVELVFKAIVRHAKQWFVPILYGAFQEASGVGDNKQGVEQLLSSRYKALLDDPAEEADSAPSLQRLPMDTKSMELLLGDYFEVKNDKTNPRRLKLTAIQ